MKTTLLFSAYVILQVALPSFTFGQAYFAFDNRDLPRGIDAPVFDANDVPLAGTNYLAELYGGPEPGDLIPAAGEETTNRIRTEFRAGGYFYPRPVTIPTVGGFYWAWLQVRAWDARLGATYEEVAARGLGGYGESPLFYAQGSQPGHLNFPFPLIGLQSFHLRPATPGVLLRGIRREGAQAVIEWHPGFARYQLQQTLTLDPSWENVGGPTTATSATNSISAAAQFFRVIGLLD